MMGLTKEQVKNMVNEELHRRTLEYDSINMLIKQTCDITHTMLEYKTQKELIECVEILIRKSQSIIDLLSLRENDRTIIMSDHDNDIVK